MKLSEAEMRMVFQIESTNQNAALNEIYMTWRYAPNPATKETAEGLLDKLRPLSDQECMDLIRKVQAEYRLPEKARTIGEMLAEARQQSGAQKLSGHDIMALERFDPATRHMIVFDVLTHDSPVGWKGEKMRLFLTDTGYSKALENQEKGHIKIRNHAPIIIKCTETHMSRLCIFLFISTPKDGGETDGKIPLPDLRGQEEDRGVAPDRRPAGRHRGPPLRPLHHDLQGAPARRDRRAGRKPARRVQRRAGREAAP